MRFKRIARLVFCLWILAMLIVWVIFHDEPQCIDACRFMRNAINNWNNGTLYPSRIDLYQDYITAVGYSNYLQLVHFVFGNLGWVQFLNMAMNISIVCELFYIARTFFNDFVGYASVVLYCLMTTNLFPFLQLVTEIPYLFLALSAFCLSVKSLHLDLESNIKNFASVLLLIVAGVFFAVAHTIRAVELAFVVPTAVYTFLLSFKKFGNVRHAVERLTALLLPYCLSLLFIGLFFKAQTGVFVNGAMTGWHNFIKISDEQSPVSTGDSYVYMPGGYAYISKWEQYTFAERDSIYKDRSIKWVRQHPFRFLAVYVARCAKLWGADYFYIPNLTGYEDYQTVIHSNNATRGLFIRRGIEICYSAVWYVVFLVFLSSVVFAIKKYLNENTICRHHFSEKALGYCTLLMVIVLGTLGTCLFPIEIRFHYPYTWAVTIIAGSFFQRLFQHFRPSHEPLPRQ